MRLAYGFFACVTALLAQACGGDDSAPETTAIPTAVTSSLTASPALSASSAGSTVNVPFPFQNALQARASLLGNARFGQRMDSFDNADPLALSSYPAWQQAYPSLRLVGSNVAATPNTVSVYRGPLNSKESPSATNPKVIVFAVADTSGVCAAGVVRGFPTYDRYESVDIGSAPCTAQSAVDVLRR